MTDNPRIPTPNICACGLKWKYYNEGYDQAKKDIEENRQNSYKRGYDTGYVLGYNAGKEHNKHFLSRDKGYTQGYHKGYAKGSKYNNIDCWKDGYEEGFKAGIKKEKEEWKQLTYDKGYEFGVRVGIDNERSKWKDRVKKLEQESYEKGYNKAYKDLVDELDAAKYNLHELKEKNDKLTSQIDRAKKLEQANYEKGYEQGRLEHIKYNEETYQKGLHAGIVKERSEWKRHIQKLMSPHDGLPTC